MLKSLEKLRGGYFAEDAPHLSNREYAIRLADEIQDEADKNLYTSHREAAEKIGDLLDREDKLLQLAKLGYSKEQIERIVLIILEYGSLDTYIDKFYLPSPLFEDGEPAQFGDQFEHSGGIDAFLFLEDGTREVWSRGERFVLQPGERLSRPPESDTQEKIDADVARIAHGYATNTSVEESMAIEIEVLLARQRKLDGVE